MKPESENLEISTNAIILEEYLSRYAPAERYEGGVIIRTTSDIISDLSEMTDLEPDAVNMVMIAQGYRPGRNNSGSFGWLMRHRAD